MSSAQDSPPIDLAREKDFAVGSASVRPASRLFIANGVEETVEPRVMQVLVLLSRNAGEVVSRDDLIAKCWGGRVVGDDAINRPIAMVRKLGESSGAFSIETITRVGYRLTVKDAMPIDHETSNLQPEAAAEQRVEARSASSRARIWVASLAAASAILAGLSFFLMQAPAGKPASQRIAFFGFTPTSADSLAADIAANATNETFQALLALRLEAASRADTQRVELTQQRARAAELGAAYALAGEVRLADGAVSIHMHLEDVATRTTLWEKTVNGAAADTVSLPVLAAEAATGVARCMAAARPNLPRQDGDLLAQLATACDTPFRNFRDATARWRALATHAPDSAIIQASLGNSLLYYANHAGLSAAELREVWKEATTAAQRALAIESDNGVARTVLAYNAIFEGRPIAEAGKLMDAAVMESPDDWRRGETGSNREEFLHGVGRNTESLAAAKAAIDRDPLSPTPYAKLAYALARVGRTTEAGRIFEQMSARWPDNRWENWAVHAVRNGVSDIDVVLAAAPSRVSSESKTCWLQLAKAYASNNPAVRRTGAEIAQQCGADGRIDALTSDLMRIRLLGDVEGLLVRYGSLLDRSLPSGFLANAGALLNKSERAFRAHPQFLPLMKNSGLYQYWLDTGTHPDICDLPEEKDFEVCARLRVDQARK